MTQFHVGQKVTAIRRELSEFEVTIKNRAAQRGVSFPQIGSVYTVRDIYSCVRSDGQKVTAIRLNEIRNDTAMKFYNGEIGEIGFDARCFRPVVERKTDISVFKALLNPQKTEVTA